MGKLLFSHVGVTNVKLINEKNYFKYYSLYVRETLETVTTL